MRNKKLFYIVTTIPLSLNFFRGQLAYLSNNFEIVAISSDRDALEKFGETEGIETHCIPMVRSISLLHDFKSLIKIISFFLKNRHKAQRKAKFYINKCRSASCMQGELKQASA